jgi:DNA-binding response OmpR family regulator
MSKVLLVADASWVVNEVRSSLTLGDWEVDEVTDPRQASKLVSERRAAAVIVDMQVGSMGGMAVVRDIRQSFDEASRPRTVLLLDRSVDEFIARRAGADACVLKPITASDLREALGPGSKPVEQPSNARTPKAAPAASGAEVGATTTEEE